MGSRERAFVRHHTTVRPVPGLEEVRLHLADEVLPLWHALAVETGDPDTPLPYWAFAWVGGLAIGRYLRDDPGVVAGLRVLDLASGSGLCAVRAAMAGAAEVTAVDIDPYSAAAIALNARANRCSIAVLTRDILDKEPPPCDVVLAGDAWYEAGLAARVTPWLRAAQRRGSRVLVGDAGRRYLPLEALEELASYEVRTTTELEDLALKRGHVFALVDRG
ncbi:MAG: 50S ribosomal protein L11 methyltransferase [Chloroflexota bacterium]